LRQLDPFIGSQLLRQVHIGALQDFIASRRKAGVKTKSINHALAVVRRVLNLAASE
jgi:integrase